MTDEEKSFKVTDRRKFSPDADESNQEKVEKEDAFQRGDESQPPESEPDARPKADAPGGEEKETSQPSHLPKINFSTFIISLNSSALVQLGLIEDPVTGKKDKNLALAKQTIDIIGMLEEKTKGNLNDEEAMMLKNILYDLRMMYVREKN